MRKVLCANWPGSRKERKMGARRPFWIRSQKWALGRHKSRKINGCETDGTWEEILSCLWGKSLRAFTLKLFLIRFNLYCLTIRWFPIVRSNYLGKNALVWYQVLATVKLYHERHLPWKFHILAVNLTILQKSNFHIDTVIHSLW